MQILKRLVVVTSVAIGMLMFGGAVVSAAPAQRDQPISKECVNLRRVTAEEKIKFELCVKKFATCQASPSPSSAAPLSQKDPRIKDRRSKSPLPYCTAPAGAPVKPAPVQPVIPATTTGPPAPIAAQLPVTGPNKIIFGAGAAMVLIGLAALIITRRRPDDEPQTES